ncbi:MAG: hypothetical protein ED559_10965 [Phycisphaera sp.]|nr:MAG: hypothetical protein ED559_10965 [Phycisphaera sp.]
MNKIKERTKPTVRTSARDPITQWLDVFTKLLALPPAERERIRDELEDHLRMRVDDLMILGKSEPEATEKAVAELGETAELAKRFKEARTSTRRRRLMHTTMFAAAGLALTVGAMNMIPGSAPMPVTAPSQVAAEKQPERSDGMNRDLAPGNLEDIFNTIAESHGVKHFVHWGSLDEAGVYNDSEVGAIPASGLSMGKVAIFLNSHLSVDGADAVTARFEDDILEFGTVRYFDKRELITIDHDVSDLVPAGNVLEYTAEADQLRKGITTVVEPYIWRGEDAIGAIVCNGSQLSVRAPERVQGKIIEYIERLRAIQHQKHGAAERALDEAVALQRRNQEELIEQTHKRFVEVSKKIQDIEQDLHRTNYEYYTVKLKLEEIERRYHDAADGEERQELGDRLVNAQVDHGSLESKRSRLRYQLDVALNRQSELEQTMNVLQTPTAASQSSRMLQRGERAALNSVGHVADERRSNQGR